MKIMLPSQGTGMDSALSPFFGRCPYFMVVDVADGKIMESRAIENEAATRQGGAGVAAAQLAHETGADAVVAEAVGPKAFSALESLGIKVYKSISGTVQENVDAFLQGRLPEAGQDSTSVL